ncbi:telomere-protecting terminal protein Tpg [Streptomyces cyaneofuscatus]|uniref:telomere-protecting terminal protein Tpg n=1 Tax=Streptomyces cyaneofuscatus TaxID=66883 RepID=UPI002E0FFC06|nr:helix-turn-helix domain-containing protein [Streptomyces cyaneofuscatus]WSI52706.1 helix-turn-helix domain-containing protein [Streptomyces cyaneofuscatus]
MVTVEEELGRAVQQAFTRPVPKSSGAQMRYLVRQHRGSTQQVADLLGISRRTVERYVKGRIKHPRPQLATRLENEVRTRWQPQVRARARQKAASTDGIMIDVQARFGYTATAGSTDQSRIRHLTLALSPRHAARLLDAQAAGVDEDQLLQLTAEALGEVYFRDNGKRAHGLEVELTDVLDLQFRL